MELKTDHLYLVKFETELKNKKTGQTFNFKELLSGFFNLDAEENDTYFEGIAFGKNQSGSRYSEPTFISKYEYDDRFTVLKDLGEIL